MAKQAKKPADEPSLIDHISKSLDHLSSRTIQIALIAALTISVISYLIMNAVGGVEKLRSLVESAGLFAPLVFIGLKTLTYVIAPLSGTPLKLIGGALFGFWDGLLFIVIGDVLGASLNFWIARLFRVKAIVKLGGKKTLKQIDSTTQHVGGWRALLAARLFLSSLYDYIAYAAGLSNLPFRQFFLVTLFAGIPSSLFAAWMGDSLLSNPVLFFGLVGLGALSIGCLFAYNKWLNKNQKG